MQRGPNFNPFPGLRPFETDEYDLFFGRAEQSKELLDRLSSLRFVAVVGASGSGKSSLVRAGLVPLLWGGRLPQAGSQWRVAILRPGDNPIHNLAGALSATDVLGKAAQTSEDAVRDEALLDVRLRRSGLGLIEVVRLARLPEGQNLLIIVDQFEELFRFADTPGRQEDAAAFVKLLLESIRQADLPVYVVLTMRSDFIGDCARFRDLAETVAGGLYLIPRMTREQRRAAIEEPVRVANGTIARRLVTRVLNDAGDDPDQLPIMQHALMRTWDHWSAREHDAEPLDLADYEAVGGMAQALSRHADEAYDALDPRGQEIARRMFQRLTAKGADHREVRRAANVSTLLEVTGASKEELARVIGEFRKPGRSFLMPPATVPLEDDPPIDISHESLIRRWDRLAQWVEEESEAAKMYQRLAETARLHAQGRAGLWSDPDLSSSLEWKARIKPSAVWARRYDPDFDQAMAFLDESKAARDAAVRRKKRQQVARAGIAFATMGILLAATVVALVQREHAIDAADRERVLRQDSAQTARVARSWLSSAMDDEISSIEDVLSFAPPTWASYLYRQRSYWRNQADDRTGAREDIDIALARKPDDLTSILYSSELHLIEGNGEEALRGAQVVLDVNPTNPSAHLLLVLSEAMLGHYDHAVTAIDRCVATCRMPTSWSESVLAPDVRRFTEGFKRDVRDSDFLLALRYTKAFIRALAGDDRFEAALEEADRSDADFPGSIDAYVSALNWQWLILRGHAVDPPGAASRGEVDGVAQDIGEYGAYAARGALWSRVAATHAEHRASAQEAFERFTRAHAARHDARYDKLARWVSHAAPRIDAPRGRESLAGTARDMFQEAEELNAARGSSSDPVDFAPAIAKLGAAIRLLDAQPKLGRREQDMLIRLLLRRSLRLLDAKDTEGAKADASRVIQLTRSAPEAYRLLAAASGDRSDAMHWYEEALKVDNSSVAALDGLSDLVAEKDPERALQLLEQHRLATDLWASNYAKMAALQYRLGRAEDAMESIETAISLAPWRIDFYESRRTFERDPARGALRYAVGLATLASYRARVGKDSDAVQMYVKALTELARLDKGDGTIGFELDAVARSASRFLTTRQGAEATRDFWTAFADDPVALPRQRDIAKRELERLQRLQSSTD